MVAVVETGTAGEVGATEELGTTGTLEATEELGTRATGLVEVVHSVVVVVVVNCIRRSN